MKWICMNCGRKNDQLDATCTKCNLEQETAMTMYVEKRRTSCEECGHVHHEDVFCHVYTDAAGEGEMDDTFVEEDDNSDDNDSDDDDAFAMLTRSKTKPKALPTAKKVKMKPLSTPEFAKRAGFIRCNCQVGIPNDSLKFEPIPRQLYNGKIQIQTFFDIMDPNEKLKFDEQLRIRCYAPEVLQKKREEDTDMIASNLPLVLSFLTYGLCSEVPKVCRKWNYGTNLYREYIDIRNFIPWQVYRPNAKQIDSILVHGNKVFTGGDHRVYCTDYQQGVVLSTVTRDSGDITRLLYKDGDIFVCSSNGSVRSYGLTHTGTNMKLLNTMWDHTKTISDLMASIPSYGPCVNHGIEGHVCYLYTSSEDRTSRMWNAAKLTIVRTIYSDALRTCTFTKMAQSYRHLFVGTTAGSVAVFSKFNRCEREDIHLCSVPGSDQAYCLQVTLRLPARKLPSGNVPWVTGLICPAFGQEYPHLWASDAVGNLTIWQIPSEGLEFVPAHTAKVHQGPINHMTHTWRHAITIGDDGYLVLHDIISFTRIRSVNIMEWSIYRNLLENPHIHRKLKSVSVYENYDTGGQLAVGTSYGDVIMLSLGTTV